MRQTRYNCIDTPNPLPPPNTVWLEEMTWMDVRDALKAGKTTMIITTGGIEPNGPWLALGKHNYVLRANCDAIARKLGNALCAPIVPFVPEGTIEPKSSHMTTVGTISMREETFQAILTDMVHSFKMHGFQNIILIGDSGGNARGMEAVAEKLNTRVERQSRRRAHPRVLRLQRRREATSMKQGLTKEGQGDKLHDDPVITMNMMVADPEQRALGTAREGRQGDDQRRLDCRQGQGAGDRRSIVEIRANNTVAAISKAIANKGKSATQQ